MFGSHGYNAVIDSNGNGFSTLGNYDISRNAISKQINVIRDKLKGYENKLNLHTKKEKIYKALESTSDHAVAEIIKNIILYINNCFEFNWCYIHCKQF